MGYPETKEEMSLGACPLAVPVRDPDRQVVAALGLTVSRLDQNAAQLLGVLTVAANEIGRSLATLSR